MTHADYLNHKIELSNRPVESSPASQLYKWCFNEQADSPFLVGRSSKNSSQDLKVQCSITSVSINASFPQTTKKPKMPFKNKINPLRKTHDFSKTLTSQGSTAIQAFQSQKKQIEINFPQSMTKISSPYSGWTPKKSISTTFPVTQRKAQVPGKGIRYTYQPL